MKLFNHDARRKQKSCTIHLFGSFNDKSTKKNFTPQRQINSSNKIENHLWYNIRANLFAIDFKNKSELIITKWIRKKSLNTASMQKN